MSCHLPPDATVPHHSPVVFVELALKCRPAHTDYREITAA